MNFLFSFIAPKARNIDYQAIEDRLIREQQEKELKEAEVLARSRVESERLKKERAEKEKQEAEYLKRKEEEEKFEKLKKIGEEPDPGPNVTQIAFRLPTGEKIERRFNQDTLIEAIYLFIETKGFQKFEIVAGFPTKVIKEGTLLTEGLTPRALLHIRLISE